MGLVMMLRPRDIKVVYLPEPQQFVGLWPFDWAVKRGLGHYFACFGVQVVPNMKSTFHGRE